MARPKTTAPLRAARPARTTRFLILGGVLYLTLSLGHLMIQEVRLLNQARILRVEKAATELKGRKLIQAIGFARTPEGVERLARLHLGMARPGEVPVRFVSKTGAIADP